MFCRDVRVGNRVGVRVGNRVRGRGGVRVRYIFHEMLHVRVRVRYVRFLRTEISGNRIRELQILAKRLGSLDQVA